jgi:polar amino acid transport system permease protein
MTCGETLNAYAWRAIGIGERLLPKSDITFCEQVVLVGSGLIWNIYYAVFAITLGFWLATLIAVGKNSPNRFWRGASVAYVYVFRGTPLFLQFFFVYELFVLLPKYAVDINLGFAVVTAETRWLTRAWLGGAIVLFLNTAAYSAEIFYGALRAVPVGQLEAADALGLSKWRKFRHITWPTMLRLAWPAYTNEAICLFHATTLIYFSSFPAWRQKGDALYYASYFAEKTFNPFVAYPIIAAYFIVITLSLIGIFGRAGKRLNKHNAAR